MQLGNFSKFRYNLIQDVWRMRSGVNFYEILGSLFKIIVLYGT